MLLRPGGEVKHGNGFNLSTELSSSQECYPSQLTMTEPVQFEARKKLCVNSRCCKWIVSLAAVKVSLYMQ